MPTRAFWVAKCLMPLLCEMFNMWGFLLSRSIFSKLQWYCKSPISRAFSLGEIWFRRCCCNFMLSLSWVQFFCFVLFLTILESTLHYMVWRPNLSQFNEVTLDTRTLPIRPCLYWLAVLNCVHIYEYFSKVKESSGRKFNLIWIWHRRSYKGSI